MRIKVLNNCSQKNVWLVLVFWLLFSQKMRTKSNFFMSRIFAESSRSNPQVTRNTSSTKRLTWPQELENWGLRIENWGLRIEDCEGWQLRCSELICIFFRVVVQKGLFKNKKTENWGLRTEDWGLWGMTIEMQWCVFF